MLNITAARMIAYDTFKQVMDDKKLPEDLLEQSYEQHKGRLTRLDRNFIKEILYGGLRWHQKLYWILQQTAKRDLDQSSGEIRAALVLGTYQIYYMDRVPDRAAVNESVEYIRKKGQSSACSFVNGILRQIARRAQYFAKPNKTTHPNDYLALQYSHPLWLVKKWAMRFKFDRLETMLASNNRPPPFSIRINTLKESLSQSSFLQAKLLKEEKTHTERRPLRTSLRVVENPVLTKDSAFGQGYYSVQDEASQLIGLLTQPAEGEWIVDACAGPGGKLSHLYELGHGKVKLTGIDRCSDRLQRAKENFVRLGHDEPEWIVEDFLHWEPKGRKKPDKIVLDAPCSGFGVFRRHPEGKWHKKASLPAEYAKVQMQLIEHGLRCLKVGGELIYSVCSFEVAETEQHLGDLLVRYGDYIHLASPAVRLPDYYKKYVTRDNVLLIYSGNTDDMDGFGSFVLTVKKKLPKDIQSVM